MYPDDENGQVLRDMQAAGVDLASPRVIDFQHVFPDEPSARRFWQAVRSRVDEANLFEPEGDDGEAGWEVECRIRMVPTHAAITELETSLAALAEQFGGHADGWGSLSNPDGSPAA